MLVPDPTQQPTLPLKEAARLCGISESAARESAHRYLETGIGLPVLRLGGIRRLVVPTAEFRRFLGIDPPHAGTESAEAASVSQLFRRRA